MPSFSHPQQKALAWIPRVSGSLSILGSAWMITSVLKDRKKRGATYHRLVCSMSCFDMIHSIWYALSTLPIPEGTTGVYGARGTQGTCSAQGFFVQLALAGPCYNVCLALYYLLVIYYGWKDDRVKKVERWMHSFVVVFALGTAIVGLPLELYNNSTLWCWIAELPKGCDKNDSVDCVRGENASKVYKLLLFLGPLWFGIFLATVAMLMIYWKVRKQEDVANRWRQGGDRSKNKLSRQVAWQAFWYLSVFYLTWTPSTIMRILGRREYALLVLVAFFSPLQGALNCLVYIRPGYMRNRRKSRESFLEQLFRRATFFFRKDVANVDENVTNDPDTSDVVRKQSEEEMGDIDRDPSSYIASTSVVGRDGNRRSETSSTERIEDLMEELMPESSV